MYCYSNAQAAMRASSDAELERVKVREVAGIFELRDELDSVIDALLLAGFDRSDIDIMASAESVREKLGAIYVPAEDLADVSSVPRRAFIARRDDVTTATALIAGVLSYVGATAAALGVVASGGTLALAAAAAITSGAAAGGIGALFARSLGAKQAEEIEFHIMSGGVVLWVRVRSPDHEQKAEQILQRHGAQAVRTHEIEIPKRLQDIPLSSIRPDPWLGDERLGDV
jgi:hypothetical protein